MVGWHLLLLLAVEIALYGALGWYLRAERGWSLACSIGIAVAIYVGVRVILIAAEFALAGWKGSAVPENLRIPRLDFIKMYLRELGGWLLMFGMVMPFIPARRSVIDRPASADRNKRPILLVHGLGCNRGNWFWFRRELERRGYRVYTVDCTPPLTHVPNYAPQIARAIDEILESMAAKDLVLIAHSMGGLVCRAYLDEYGPGKVAHVITIGTPHLGTWMARLGVGPNVRDMNLDSPWLAGLRERETSQSARIHPEFTCVYTYHDNLVTPQTNAVLPGSRSIALSGIGHLSLLLSRDVVTHVAGVLQDLVSIG